MMIAQDDPIPSRENKIAYLLGYLLHPYLICIPTLLAVMQDYRLMDALKWAMLLLSILLLPIMATAYLSEKQKRFIYQRRSRTPIYLIGWMSILISIAVISIGKGSERLLASFCALAIWIPMMLIVNRFYTKLSAHAGVSMGCMLGLFFLGTLDTPLLKLVALILVLLTAWARYITRNHTIPQLLLGWITSATAVSLAFWIILEN